MNKTVSSLQTDLQKSFKNIKELKNKRKEGENINHQKIKLLPPQFKDYQFKNLLNKSREIQQLNKKNFLRRKICKLVRTLNHQFKNYNCLNREPPLNNRSQRCNIFLLSLHKQAQLKDSRNLSCKVSHQNSFSKKSVRTKNLTNCNFKNKNLMISSQKMSRQKRNSKFLSILSTLNSNKTKNLILNSLLRKQILSKVKN